MILFSKSKLFFDENLAFLSILIYGIFRLFPLLSQFNTNFGSLVKLEKGSETIKKSLQNLSQDQTKDIEFNISDIKKNELIIKNYSITINKKLIEDSNLYLNQVKYIFLLGQMVLVSHLLKSLLHVNDYEGEIFMGMLN